MPTGASQRAVEHPHDLRGYDDRTLQTIHVIINPAAGRNEPILNILNDVFRQHQVEWDVSITHWAGDAARQAREAVATGVDLVAGYGGDGTQMAVLNGVVGGGTPMAILPGGTGNAMAFEFKIPRDLKGAEAVQMVVPTEEHHHWRRVTWYASSVDWDGWISRRKHALPVAAVGG